MKKRLVTARSAVEQRLIMMLKQTNDWTPKSEFDEHDRKLVLRTINYALTGRVGRRKVNKQ